MFFQTLDDKTECVGYFSDGELSFADLPPQLTKTWNYSVHLKDRDIEYAKLYCGGKSLDEACPEHLRGGWDKINAKLKYFLDNKEYNELLNLINILKKSEYPKSIIR